MSAGADADIVPAAPDVDVVGRAGGDASRVVGDLIGVEPGLGEDRLGRIIEVFLGVFVGRNQAASGLGPAEGRARLDGQLVG